MGRKRKKREKKEGEKRKKKTPVGLFVILVLERTKGPYHDDVRDKETTKQKIEYSVDNRNLQTIRNREKEKSEKNSTAKKEKKKSRKRGTRKLTRA